MASKIGMTSTKALITMLLLLISFNINAESTLESKDWAICKSEIEKRTFPRACLVLAVLSQKLNFLKMHKELDAYCLENIKRWEPIDPADIVILERYYPKCLHRLYSISNTNHQGLKVENIRSDLVRFLYLGQDADSDPDSKRVSNIITTGPGSK